MAEVIGTGDAGSAGGPDSVAGGASVESGAVTGSATPEAPVIGSTTGTEKVTESRSSDLYDEPDDEAIDFFTSLGGEAPARAPAAAPQAPPAGAPTVPPQQAQQPQAAQPQAPAQPGQPQAPAQAPAPTQVEAPRQDAPLTPDLFLAQVQANAPAILEQLASDPRFIPTDEQIAAFDADPKVGFARMGAQLHLNSMMAAANFVREMVPRMVHEAIASRAQESEVETAFKTDFPDLDLRDPGVMNAVQTAAMAAQRAPIPNETKAQRIARVGGMARVLMGIQAPPPSNGAPRAVPFQPARSGAGVAPVQGQPDLWAGLGQSYD